MKHAPLMLLPVFAVLAGCQVSDVRASEPVEVSTDRDFAQFLSYWPGEYSNNAQVAKEARRTADRKREHMRLIVKAIDLPSFGEHAFYVEWQEFKNPDKVLRQRIYGFEMDGEEFRLNLHIFPNDKEFVERTSGAHLDPTKLAGVTPDDMAALPGCDVFFRATNDSFAGAMQKQSCRFNAPGTGEPIYSWSQMQLTSQSFQYLDGWFRMDDDSLFRRSMPDWVVFDKLDSGND